jgi:hypothetical protein
VCPQSSQAFCGRFVSEAETEEEDESEMESGRVDAVKDQTRATTQPMKDQPSRRFRRKIAAVLECPRARAMTKGRK